MVGRSHPPAFCLELQSVASSLTERCPSDGGMFAFAVPRDLQLKTGGRRRFYAVSSSRNRKIAGRDPPFADRLLLYLAASCGRECDFSKVEELVFSPQYKSAPLRNLACQKKRGVWGEKSCGSPCGDACPLFVADMQFSGESV